MGIIFKFKIGIINCFFKILILFLILKLYILAVSEELYKEGYKRIVNIDYSENCIKIMNDRYSTGYDDTFSCKYY